MAIAAAMWVLIACTVAVYCLSLAIAWPAPRLAFWTGCAAALATAFAATDRTAGPSRVAVFGALVGWTALSLIVAGHFYDVTYDGGAYHQAAISFLMKGWNPILGAELPATPVENVWINHYAKGPWMLGASVASVFGSIEYGKAAGLLVVGASVAGTLAALLSLRVGGLVALLGVSALALNPVTIVQALSNYVDGVLAAGLLCACTFAVVLLSQTRWPAWLGLGCCLAFTANTKFTAIPYLAVYGFALLLLLYRPHNRRAVLLTLGIAGFVGVLGFGFNPYVRNTLDHGHPFHPLFGTEKLDIMGSQATTAFGSRSRGEKLLRSLLSRSENTTTAEPRLKMPFAVDATELAEFKIPDTRFGGFGPLFSGALVLALLCLGGIRRDRQILYPLALGVGATVISTWLNPEGWWARYTPQFWMVPGSIALCALPSPRRAVRALAIATLLALVVNSGLVAWSNVRYNLFATSELRSQLRSLAERARGRPLLGDVEGREAARVRLQESGLVLVEVGSLEGCRQREDVTIWPPAHLCLEPAPVLGGPREVAR